MQRVESKQTTLTESSHPIHETQPGFFTENKGQWDSRIKFIGYSSFGKIVFTNDALYYQLIKREKTQKKIDVLSSLDKDSRNSEDKSETYIFKLSFIGAHTSDIQGELIKKPIFNYLIGNDPEHWGIGCRNFSSITYKNIWNGIDLVFRNSHEGIYFESILDNQANLEDIQIKSQGAQVFETEHYTEFRTPIGSIYQSKKTALGIQFSDSLFSIPDEPPVFKPQGVVGWERLKFATYLGGNLNETSKSIAIDSDHNTYITGYTDSTDFPMERFVNGSKAPGYDQMYNLKDDVFVVKLNPTGTEIVYATFLGGNADDRANAIVVDEQRNAYIVGYTESENFPVSSTIGGLNAPGFDQEIGRPFFDTTSPAKGDGFVVKLNATGTSLLYSTYIGGWETDNCVDIVLDADNNAYITGVSMSGITFPFYKNKLTYEHTPGYYNAILFDSNVFVIKLSAPGTDLLYSTMFEGSNSDIGMAIDLDTDNNAIITGATNSADFSMTKTVGGVLAPGYDKTYNGGMMDGFVLKLNSTGTELLYSTFLGGSNIEQPNDIKVDSQGNAYIAGATNGSDFPMTTTDGGAMAPGYDKTFNGLGDAFAIKLNSTGTELLYATFMGGAGIEQANSLALDPLNNAYITGETWSTDFPMGITDGGVPAPGYNQAFSNENEAFLVKLNDTGTLFQYATFLGGSGVDNGQALTVDSQYNVYLTGFTKSTDFPMTVIPGGVEAPGYDKQFTLWYDAFALKLNTTESYDIFVSIPEDHGHVSPVMQSVQVGGNLCIPIQLEPYTELISILDNNIEMPLSNPYCLDNITQDHSIIIQYKVTHFTITATVSGGHGTITPAFQVIANGEDGSVSMQADSGYLIDRFTVNGQESVISYPATELGLLFFNIDQDHEIVVFFKRAPDPVLDISIELNKHEFCYGDDVLYKVTVHNTSAGPATITKLMVTFPREIQYSTSDKFRGEVQSGGVVLFDLGTIEGLSSVTFQINASVVLRTQVKSSVATTFNVSCSTEGVFAETSVYTTIKSCGGGNPVPYIKAVLLNTQFDPDTGERYIEQGKELLMDVTLDGFTPLYAITVFWGDGEKTLLDKQQDKTIQFKHEYNSGGTMEIKIHVEDQSGKSKEVSLRIKVK